MTISMMLQRSSLLNTARRLAKPAAAVAITGGSVFLFVTSEDNEVKVDYTARESHPLHIQLTNRLQEQPTIHTQGNAPRMLASSAGSSRSGGVSMFQSFVSTLNQSSAPPHLDTMTRTETGSNSKIKRQSTIELLHETANASPVEVKYKADWSSPIGRGTFGDVYEALHKKTGERVAIKKISKQFTNDDSFQREMDNLLYLEDTPGAHPSICFMREHFEGDDHFYLVLDLVQGGELFDHLVEYGAYSEKDAARVIRETGSALAFLHGIGMVHSDLKPENLMLSSKDKKDATVKIVDFGCAHLIKDDNHAEHRGTGLTPGYCPPEVLVRKTTKPNEHCHITPSFDMWSLGVIMYVMLTGTHPFDLEGTGSNLEMEHKITSYDQKLPIRDCEETKHLSEDAIDLLERLMDRDPVRRISADQLLQHPWVKGETASSSVISGSDNRLKTYLRHQTKVGTSIFKGLLSNSDKHGGSHLSKRVSVLEMAFRDLDPGNKGYISTKELNGITSYLAADAKLSLHELQHLLRDKMAPLHFSKNQKIYDQGSQGESMYILQSGSVELTSNDGFKTVRQSGEFFGEDALRAGKDGKYSHTARCLTPVHALQVSRESFEKYMQADEEVAMTMAETDRKRQRERANVIFGLQGSLKPLECDPGQIIFREGADGDLLYMLESGKVDISVDGRKVRSLRQGEMTGEHAAFYANKPYNVTAQCVSKKGCTMQTLDGNEIRKMCKKNKELHESFRDIILRRDFKKALVKATKRDFPETEQELRTAFDTIDTNKSGKIEFEFLKDIVLQWDSSYTEDDIRDMLKSLDIKNQGHLTWPEFQRILGMFNET